MASFAVERNLNINFEVQGAKSSNQQAVIVGGHSQAAFVEGIRKTRQVLTFDPRGTGQSTAAKSFGDYTVAAYRADMENLLAHVGFKSSSLVGYSNGGYFAADYAYKNPSQVSALVLIEPALFIDRAWLRERVDLALKDKDAAIDLLLQQIAGHLGRNDKKEYANLKQAISDRYPTGESLAAEWNARLNHELGELQLRSICAPTLLIGGRESSNIDKTMRAASLIPRVSTWWIPGASHLVMLQKPKEVARIVDLFLQQHAG